MNSSFPLLFISFIIIVAFIVLIDLRRKDSVHASKVWKKLAKRTKHHSPIFEESMLDGLPDIVKKFFLYMIKPGTPLQYVSELKMHGEFSLGNLQKQKIFTAKCKQIIAPLQGFVWKIKTTNGFIRFSGSDGFNNNHCWSRMWIMNLWPLGQRKENQNISKSSFGRLVAESTVWSLASLLPQKKVHWEVIDTKTIRVIVTTKLMAQQVDITLDDNGKPLEISFPRWSNENPKKVFQFQPFGAKLSSFKEIQGFMIPMQIEAGNNYATADYFPFYKMAVDSYEFV